MGNRYKNTLEISVRNFIKVLLNNELNTDSSQFKSYDDIVKFIKGHKHDYKLNVNNIAVLKRRGKSYKQVPVTKESLEFVKYVKQKFPDFDSDQFFK